MPPSSISYNSLALPASIMGKTLDQVLRLAQRDILHAVRRSITQSAFSPAAKRALANYLRVELGPLSMTITSTHPAFLPLLGGQHKGPMTWLKRARAPIPIVTEQGELIFRTPTARSFADGSWIHPGHEQPDILELARTQAHDILRERVRLALRAQLRAAWGAR